jgi:putative DNA methylase
LVYPDAQIRGHLSNIPLLIPFCAPYLTYTYILILLKTSILLLPEDISIEAFKNIVRLNAKRTPHREKPIIDEFEDYFKGKKLLDPFAGFGSIPLEAMRLGLDVTAVDLLPTAYIFLKAVLEYPAKYGEKLIDDVKYWGNWVTERLREDEDIKEL